jgi:ubiquinone/menaquinone biosynthesis C-methylase UbiE
MQVPANWSAIAKGYAEVLREHGERFAQEALRLVPPKPSDHVLDLAAGPGMLAFLAARAAQRVTAVDFAPGMVDQIRARAERECVSNVTAEVMDAQSLGFPDETFDALYCLFAFFFVPDRARAFRELVRVLRPGGRALVATWAPIDRRPLMKVAFDAFEEALPHLPRPEKGDLQTPEECMREMSEAGFRDVVVHRFTAGARVDSADQYFDIIERGGPMLMLIKGKLGDEAYGAVREKLLAALRKRIPEGGCELGAEALMSIGTR